MLAVGFGNTRQRYLPIYDPSELKGMIIRLGSQNASAAVATPWDPLCPVGRATYATISARCAINTETLLAGTELPQYHPDKRNHTQANFGSNVVVTLWVAAHASDITKQVKAQKSSYLLSSSHIGPSTHIQRKSDDNSSISKFFHNKWTSSISFPSWPVAKILSVANVLDEQTQATFTHILIALSSNSKPIYFPTQDSDTGHGLALIRIEAQAITKLAVFNLQGDLPSQALILRGPIILAITDNLVRSFRLSNHDSSDGYTPEQQLVGTSATQPVIGSTQKDTLALVLASSGQNWNLTSLQTTSSSIASSHIATFPYTAFPAPPVFIYGTCSPLAVVVMCENGSIATVDVNTRSILNVTPPSPLKEFSDGAAFENNLYLASAYPPHQIHFVPLKLTDFKTEPDRNVGSLSAFPECRSAPASSPNEVDALSVTHGHFYTAWRGRMFMVNAITGTCCVERNGILPLVSTIKSKSPSVESMVQNLRERVDSGVSAYTETVLANNEKRHMLHHTASLLTDIARAPTISPRTHILDVRLQRVITRVDNRVSVSTLRDLVLDSTDKDTEEGDTQMADLNAEDGRSEKELGAHPGPVRLWVAGQSPIDASPAFLQVTRAHCSLDPTETFIVVDIDADLLEPLSGSGGTDEPKINDKNGFTFLLGLRIDQCVSSISNMTVHRKMSSKRNVAHIRATAPLADMVTAGIPLNEVHIYVRVDGSDGSCQHLGQFSMRDLLSNGKNEGQLVVPHTFEENVYVIAEGRNAHKLKIESPGLNNYMKEVFRQEGIICLALNVTNGVALASAIARLKIAVDDEVSLRWTLKIQKKSLDPVNHALIELQQELQSFREIAAPSDAIGYSAQQVSDVLAQQQKVDQAFGRVEELCPEKLVI